MTITAIVITVILALLKLLVTCLPNDAVAWILRKFELHSKLDAEEASISFDGKALDEQARLDFIHYFNEAAFMKKQHIFPGNEDLFLHPKDKTVPFIIDTKKGKHAVRMFVYFEQDKIEVVKQYKKKLYAYSLRSAEAVDPQLILHLK